MSHWNFHTKWNEKSRGNFFSEGTKKPRENGEGIQYRSKGIFICFWISEFSRQKFYCYIVDFMRFMRFPLAYFHPLCFNQEEKSGLYFFPRIAWLTVCQESEYTQQKCKCYTQAISKQGPFVSFVIFPPWMNVFVIIISTVGKRGSSLGNVMPPF